MIKLNSWHYKLANFGTKRIWSGDSINFCEYFWAVVTGLIVLMVTAFALIISSIMVLGSLYEFIMWIIYGTKMHDGALVVVVFLSVLLIAIGLGQGISKYYEYMDKLDYEEPDLKEPGFFTLAYRKFKDKACFKVKIEGEN